MVDQHGLEHLARQAAELRRDLARPPRSGTRRGRATPRAGRGRRTARAAVARAQPLRDAARARSSGSSSTKRSSQRSLQLGERSRRRTVPPAPRGRKRWPRVASPLATIGRPCAPATELVDRERHHLPSSSATSQRIGRPNGNAPLPSSSQASQLMRFGNASARSRRGEKRRQHLARRAARDLLARRAGRARRAWPRPSAPAAEPRPRRRSSAKPCAARVHAPAASFATLSAGPQTGSSRSAWRASSSAAQHQPARRPRHAHVLRLQELARRPRPRSAARSCSARPGEPARRHLLAADLEQELRHAGLAAVSAGVARAAST